MHQSNTFLHTVVHDAGLLCVAKLDLAKSIVLDQTELQLLESRVRRVFEAVNQPGLWDTPIHCPPALILPFNKSLGDIGKNNLDLLPKAINDLLDVLESRILNTNELENGHSEPVVATNSVNLEVCEALLKVQMALGELLDRFAAAGDDLRKDEQFKTLQEEQSQLFNNYFQKLTHNELMADRREKDMLMSFVKFYQTVQVKSTFIDGFKQFTTYLNSRIQPA